MRERMHYSVSLCRLARWLEFSYCEMRGAALLEHVHTHLDCYCKITKLQFTVATRDNHAELAFSEEFDTDTCGDFERVHVELIGASRKMLHLWP